MNDGDNINDNGEKNDDHDDNENKDDVERLKGFLDLGTDSDKQRQ
jgi:hypothetical protein